MSNVNELGTGNTLYAGYGNTLLTSGKVCLGVFSAGFDVASQAASENLQSLIANYSVLASGSIGAFSVNLEGSFPGYVDAPAVSGGIVTTGNPLLGRDLYSFVGNGSTLASSSNWVLLFIGTIQDDASFEHVYSSDPSGLTPLYGSKGTFTGDPGTGFGTYNTIKFIPEPSIAAMGLLGALGLFARRR